MAHYRVVPKHKIVVEWIQNGKGRFVGSMSEDDEGRAVVKCTTLLPPFSPPPPMLLPINEENEEVLTAAVDIDLLHRRLGHMGKTAMARLVKEDLVRGMEGGAGGELGICRGCELGKPLAEPHPPKSVLYNTEIGACTCGVLW